MLCANFFEVETSVLKPVDAVVGNPPYIRYQRFTGKQRDLALQRARDAGVAISRLTSAWAPFVVYAVQFVRFGGKLAFVIPSELSYAKYAQSVLSYLCHSFRKIHVITFSKRLFPKLSEDTVLLLAEGRGQSFETVELIELPDADALSDLAVSSRNLPAGTLINDRSAFEGNTRLLSYLLPTSTRKLYNELGSSSNVITLGQIADVGIGYVTGDNDFFHVDLNTSKHFSLPQRFLKRAVRTGSDLVGLRFTDEDWQVLHHFGQANLLLHIMDGMRLSAGMQKYLSNGVTNGVSERYKCRVRQLWYQVPHVYEADGFLTYMSNNTPKLVINEAKAVAPNTLHVVRLFHPHLLEPIELACLWQTSLTGLSCEIEGHGLGGGLLKLEPKEARQVLVPKPALSQNELFDLANELDRLLRVGHVDQARDRADLIILERGLGLTVADIEELKRSTASMRRRRSRKQVE